MRKEKRISRYRYRFEGEAANWAAIVVNWPLCSSKKHLQLGLPHASIYLLRVRSSLPLKSYFKKKKEVEKTH